MELQIATLFGTNLLVTDNNLFEFGDRIIT